MVSEMNRKTLKEDVLMTTLIKWVDAPARLLMTLLFMVSGVGKCGSITATQAYMESYGVPGFLTRWRCCSPVGAY